MVRLVLFSTTEIAEGSGRNGMCPPDRLKNATDYTSSRPLASFGRRVGVRRRWARTLNRSRLGLKSVSGKPVARGNDCRSTEANPAVRFRLHSFARSVADLDFAPKGNEHRHEAEEREWARNRIIGHGFRVAARLGWLIPFFPPPSAISVVKNKQVPNPPLLLRHQIL